MADHKKVDMESVITKPKVLTTLSLVHEFI